MDDFNERFVDAFKKAGLSVHDEETGKKFSRTEFLDYLNQHTLYEIDGSWYTRDSVFCFGGMLAEYAERFKGSILVAEELCYYMLTDCNVSGLCIVSVEGKYGLFPLQERTGDQDGVWCCNGYPFIYDDVRVFADWNNWYGYGYVAAKKESGWGVIKVTQFPEPSNEIMEDFKHSSVEDAMKAAGIKVLPNEEPFVKRL